MHLFCSNVIFVIPVRHTFQSYSQGINNTSIFCLVFPSIAAGFPAAIYWCFTSHCYWHRNFQLSTSVFHRVFKFFIKVIGPGCLLLCQPPPGPCCPSGGFSFSIVNRVKPRYDLRPPHRLTRPFEAHPGATTVPSALGHFGTSALATATAASSLPDGPTASHKYLFSTHDHGRLRSKLGSSKTFFITKPLRRSDCTFSRLTSLTAEEHDRPLTWSMATPEPGCPGPHPSS